MQAGATRDPTLLRGSSKHKTKIIKTQNKNMIMMSLAAVLLGRNWNLILSATLLLDTWMKFWMKYSWSFQRGKERCLTQINWSAAFSGVLVFISSSEWEASSLRNPCNCPPVSFWDTSWSHLTRSARPQLVWILTTQQSWLVWLGYCNSNGLVWICTLSTIS